MSNASVTLLYFSTISVGSAATVPSTIFGRFHTVFPFSAATLFPKMSSAARTLLFPMGQLASWLPSMI
jgi:hypothetical protein